MQGLLFVADEPLTARDLADALALDFDVDAVGLERYTISRQESYVWIGSAGEDVLAAFPGEDPPPDLSGLRSPRFVARLRDDPGSDWD